MKIYVLCVGKIVGAGPIDWGSAPLPAPEPEPVDEADAAFDAPADCSYFAHLFPDGSLQRVIDDGAQLSEAEDARQDEEFNRRGGWL
jgi:hypothetical protein